MVHFPSENTHRDAEKPVLDLIERASFMVGNPSAWDEYDEGASEIIRDLVAERRNMDAHLHAIRSVGGSCPKCSDTKRSCAQAIAEITVAHNASKSIKRFVFPDEKWAFIKGWAFGRRSGLVLGWNWRCFTVGGQVWPSGGCLHLGFLIVGLGTVEDAA